jgi:glycogen operon protein
MVNANHPIVRRMIADSIRYWQDEYKIDGFRFDLLAALGRDEKQGFAFNPDAPVYRDIRDAARGVDPATGRRSEPGSRPAKLAGEPWDCGGYQRGRMPGWFYEWNDTYKKGVRNFWMRDARSNSLAAGLAGSSDVDNTDARMKGRTFTLLNRMKLAAMNGTANVAQALCGYTGATPVLPEGTNPFFLPRAVRSINEIGTHDGKTLADAVSYAGKHNEANGENNRDGCDDISLNHGTEGPTEDAAIQAARMKSIFNFIATLGVSHGPILIRMGDEMMQSQKGNNNAWCQDNETSWLDWSKLNEDAPGRVKSFMEYMINVRKSLSGLKSHTFMHGTKTDPLHGERNLTWYSPKGHYRTEDEWINNGLCFGMMLDNAAYPDRVQGRNPAFGPHSRLLVVFNGENEWVPFKLPTLKGGKGWGCMVNTSLPVQPS